MRELTPPMLRGEETIFLVKDRLVKDGVPVSAIVEDFGAMNRYFPDLVIVSPKYNIPISIFEVKVYRPKIEKRILDLVVRNFKQYVTSLNVTVSCYLATVEQETRKIEIYNVTHAVYGKYSFHPEDLNSLKCEKFDFEAMENQAITKLNIACEQKKKGKKDEFKYLCFWVFPLFLLLVLFLDYYNLYRFTNERFFVYVGMIIVTILPYCEKFSFGGIGIIPKKSKEDQE